MGHLIKNTIVRRILKTLMWVLIVILLIPALLYVPFVQNFVKDIALREVAKSSGMTIEIDRFRLKWPLSVMLDGVRVMTSPGDTMAVVGNADLDVDILPLLKLDIHASGHISDVRYKMGTPDSVMYLVADVKDFKLEPSHYDLKNSLIEVSHAELDGGDVLLLFNGSDTTATPVDTTASMPLTIKAGSLLLRNISYRMSMMPVIDSLSASVPLAVLRDGFLDLATRRIHARSLSVDSVSAMYLTPSAEYLAAHPADTVTTVDERPTPLDSMWVITGDTVRLTGQRAVYAMRGAVPQPGLDMNYLQADDIDIRVDSFYNRGVEITVPLKRLAATERSGVKLDASGTFAMDTAGMEARNFDITTLFSAIKFNAYMGMGDMTTNPDLPLRLKAAARIGVHDVEMLMPSLVPMLKTIPRYNDINLQADAEGTVSAMRVEKIYAALPGYMNMEMRGEVYDMLDIDKISGEILLDGELKNVNFIKPTVLEAKLAKQLNIPPIKLEGRVEMESGTYNGMLRAVTGKGEVLLDGDWNGRAESYTADLNLDEFPISSFMPEMGIGDLTANVKVKGRGYDPMSIKTTIDAEMAIDKLVYDSIAYSNMRAWAKLDTGVIDAGLMSMNHDANFDMTMSGKIDGDNINVEFEGDVRNFDLKGLHLSTTENKGSFSIDGKAVVNPKRNYYNGNVNVTDLAWSMPDMEIATPAINTTLDATDSSMVVTLHNESLVAGLMAKCPIDTFMTRVTGTMTLLEKQMADKRVDIIALQHALPPFALDLNSGANSVISDFLEPVKMSFNSLKFNMSTDTIITMNAAVDGFKTGNTQLDSIAFNALQHGKFLVYKINVNNRPGTMDDFAHVNATGFLANENFSLFLNQSNIKGDTGFKIGVNLTGSDSLLTMRLVPLKPVIGYKTWSLNQDNFISYSFGSRHLDANLDLSNGDSHLRIFTEHSHNDSVMGQEDVVVNASGIQLADWLALSPFAPPVKGVAGVDMRIRWDAEAKSLSGTGNATLDDLSYGGDRVGSFLLDLGLSTTASGVIKASTSLMVDSIKVITASGSLNDSTAAHPFALDFSMIHFPLRIVNPFLPPGVAKLHGMLNGEMDITGTMANPVFDGFLDFDSTDVLVDMVGTSFKFSDEKIPVDSNIVRFNNYTIKGINDNPLYINGTVDMTSLVSPRIDLDMKARDMQIVGIDRGKGHDVYGRGFINLDADVKGNMDFMSVNAKLNLLEGSNVTYVLDMAADQLSEGVGAGDMVRFVQFSDTAAVLQADSLESTGMSLMLNAQVIISEGSTINVDISSNGKDKAQIQGSGNLNFTMSPFSDMRITGRYTIDKGFVRYTPPFMSQKLFDFESGSYVAFNGDMLNPILNIHATETLKANVTEEGQNSRLVNFIITLNVTNTLSNMDVSFDLSTNDDITIQNELQTMSPEQRANQAMNMLLYNIYTGPGTKASSNLSGNMLFSFLTSKLNTWAANNIKGVDITFGVDQYDRTYEGATSTTTSYSYKVSKTLFNDRIKIVIGGNYSTDADNDENLSQNLINDISFEYMLNRSGSMYLRLFRHEGYENVLEGEVIQTGVGFVYKRKLSSLRDLFRFVGHRKESPEAPEPAESPAGTSPINKNNDDAEKN